MDWPRKVNFQTKVLVPVMSIMLLLVLVPMWIISRRMSRQLETSAADMLTTADAVFQNLQSIRTKNLVRRFSGVPNEPRSRAVFQKADAKTITVLLRELREEMDGDVIVFDNGTESRPFASREAHFPIEEFHSRTVGLVRQASQAREGSKTINIGSRVYDAYAIPVDVGGNLIGVLTFGVEWRDAAVQEIKKVTQSEILLLAGGRIAAGTLPTSSLSGQLSQTLHQLARHPVEIPGRARRNLATVLVEGEHFMAMARPLGSDQSSGIEYVLLSSYEKPLRALQATQTTFLWVQCSGILFGGGLIWFLIRRVTRPLRLLRDSAEAVGQGDFSKRVEIRSNDECGELAEVFNQMTSNLKASREELEMTVDTLRATQAQLIQSEKLRAIGTLAGGIAHDFNNILGAILGFSELVLDDLPAESRAGKNLHQVVKAGERAKDLVRQILAFSRQAEPQRVNVRLASIIDETVKLLRASIPSTVEIKMRVRTQADTVVADPSQLHQVLMNLGTNASHAMRKSGGVLMVTLEEWTIPETGSPDTPQLTPGPYLRLSVADTGHGMAPDVLERIFEPFFTTKPVGEGTGLGLSVVHGIIKSHGGEITVSSQPGEGTTFRVFLPRAPDAPAESVCAKDTIPGQAERILVVDDEEPLVNIMHQKLTRLGYEVVATCDSLTAWQQFQANPDSLDLVIADQTMPHLTGDDLARRIHELRPETPIILCSGSGRALHERTERGHSPQQSQAGAVYCRFVPKPVNFAELSRTLREILNDRHPPAEPALNEEVIQKR
jgi:two-component system NtrC family sensor kinase